LYFYCNNNPIDLIDPQGSSAYWITDSKTLAKLGHASLLVYIASAWYYFYFGASNFLKPINGTALVIFEKIGKNIVSSSGINLGKLNKCLKGQDGNKTFVGSKKYKGSGYDKAIKINYNFYSLTSYIDQTVKKTKYNIHKENCAWMCIEVLKKGNIGNSNREKLNNIQYRTVHIPMRYGCFFYTKTKKVANILVPAVVHGRIASIFSNIKYI